MTTNFPKRGTKLSQGPMDVNMRLQSIQKQHRNELPKIQIRQSPRKPTKGKLKPQVACIML
jgi:hypothetical protein